MDHPHQHQEPGEALIARERWATEPGLDGLRTEIAQLLKGRDDFEIAQVLISVLGAHALQAETVQRRPQLTSELVDKHLHEFLAMNGLLLMRGAGLGQILLIYMFALDSLFANATQAQRTQR